MRDTSSAACSPCSAPGVGDRSAAATVAATASSRERTGGAAAAHRACGTELVARLWCPTCDRPVDDPSHDDLEHL